MGLNSPGNKSFRIKRGAARRTQKAGWLRLYLSERRIEHIAMNQREKANTRRWAERILFAVVLWTSIGLVFALPNLGMRPAKMIFLSALAMWWSWGLLAFGIIAVDAR